MALTPTQEAQVLQLLAQQTALLSLAGNEATITSKLAATKANLSQLTAASSIADGDLMLIRQGSTDRNFIASLLKAYAQTGAVLTAGAQTIDGVKTFNENIGLGMVPIAWHANFKALQMGYAAFVSDNSSGRAEVLNNAFASGASTYNYINTLGACRYSQQLGAHVWQSAPSGTAGNPITFTQVMEITLAGQLRTRTTGGGAFMDAFACRVWVNFNGTGTVSIRSGGNVSSITDNGTGLYTVNFTTAMPDSNYAVCATSNGATSSYFLGVAATQTVSAVQVTNYFPNVGAADASMCSVAIFR